MCMLQRLDDAMKVNDARRKKCGSLRSLILKAVPYYDSDYEGNWPIDKLIEKILEICDGKKR